MPKSSTAQWDCTHEIAEWHALAVRCGLLIPAGTGHYTFKIPVVEYLIGSYYAWLVRSSSNPTNEAKDKRRLQRFVCKFRQGFWSRDFGDIWLHTFDQLWRGTSEQVKLAAGTVEWLLDFSKRCMDCVQPTGTLPATRRDEDRIPFTCHRFAIRALLPTSEVASDVQQDVNRLRDRGLAQIIGELCETWTSQIEREDNLLPVARRWPHEVVTSLLTLLRNKEFPIVRRAVLFAIRDVLAACDSLLTRQLVVDTLVPLLRNKDYKETWGPITNVIKHGLDNLDVGVVKDIVVQVLLPCLYDMDYREAWRDIAFAIVRGFAGLDAATLEDVVVRRLEPRFLDKKYGKPRGAISGAICKGLARLDAAIVEDMVVKRLLQLLFDKTYKELWPPLIGVIDGGFACLDAATVKDIVAELTRLLSDPDYRDGWGAIASAIGEGFSKLDVATVEAIVVKRLVPCLLDKDYKDASWSIIHTIVRGIDRLEEATALDIVVRQLVPRLLDKGCKEICGPISGAITVGLTQLNSAVAGEIVMQSLVPCLLDEDYRDAWDMLSHTIRSTCVRLDIAMVESIVTRSLLPELLRKDNHNSREHMADAVGDVLDALDNAAIQGLLVKTLLPCLLDTGFKKVWVNITRVIVRRLHTVSVKQILPFAKELAEQGRISDLEAVVGAVPEIDWYVRRVDDKRKRIIYGIYERHSPAVLFDPDLQAVPDSIRVLCSEPRGNAPSSLSIQSAPTSQSQFVFCRIAPEAWQIAFGKENPQAVHRHYEAFTYIAKLLEKPRTEIADLDLRFWNEPILAAEAKRHVQDDAMTREGRQKIEAEISRLEMQAQADDPAERMGAREMLDLLRDQLRKDSGFRKQRKGVRKTPAQAAQSLVGQNLEKAIAALADVGMGNLAAHLKKYIRKTGNYGREYAPPDPIPAWEAGWLIPEVSQSSR